MSIVVNNEGQISIDFLMGISVFLLSLGFILQFIPDLFTSISGEGSLNPVAYRTARILTNDPGWWENNTQNGTDWEMHTESLSRIGLARDITPGTRQTRTPNMLNRKKIRQALTLNETMFTNKLGLYDKKSGIQVDYGYNITLKQNSNTMIINGSAISFGRTPPTSQDIFKITRPVLVETSIIASFKAYELTARNLPNDKVLFNISGPQNENVIIQITDFNITTGPNPGFNWAKLNGNNLNPSEYSAYKRTNASDFVIYSDPLNSTDTMRLIFNYTLFPDNTTYLLELKFTQMNFIRTGPPYIEYTANVEPLYEPASLMVMVWN
jgi:hypothetical protein